MCQRTILKRLIVTRKGFIQQVRRRNEVYTVYSELTYAEFAEGLDELHLQLRELLLDGRSQSYLRFRHSISFLSVLLQ